MLHSPRDVRVSIEYKKKDLPYFAKGWEELFSKSNSVERAIYTLYNCNKLTSKTKKKLVNKYKGQIMTIPFETFVLDPDPWMKKIEKICKDKFTKKLSKVMKKQNIPRKKVSDGISLDIYKRCGWVPPDKKTFRSRGAYKKKRICNS